MEKEKEKGKEKGSGSSWASGSSDSLINGLKFGKKIYSIDVGGGGGGGGFESSSSSSFSKATSSSPQLPSAMAASAAQKKGKGGGGGNQHPQHQPPRCQVEGCNIDLTGAKSYYCRHKVCGMHSKSPKVVVAGLEQRFCQQCSRFHQLHEFDQGKRSCRRRLAGHNERRRKPPPDPLSSRYGRHSSSFSEDGSRFRSFLMDFSYPSPRSQFPSREQWPTARSNDRAAATAAAAAAAGSQWQGGGFDAPHYAMLPHPYTHPLPHYTSELPLNECYTDVSDSSCALSLLSSQPWGTTAAASSRIRAPNISPNNSSFDGVPMGQQMVATGGAHPWCYNAYGAANTNHEIQPIGIGHFAEDGPAQFSGELELALQGNRHYLQERGGPVRAYHSGNSMNWSL